MIPMTVDDLANLLNEGSSPRQIDWLLYLRWQIVHGLRDEGLPVQPLYIPVYIFDDMEDEQADAYVPKVQRLGYGPL